MAALVPQYRLPPICSNSIGLFDTILDIRHRRRTMILLDPGRFLNRLAPDLILILPRARSIAAKAEGMKLRATEKSKRLAQTQIFSFHSFRGLMPLVVLLAVTLSGCGDKPAQPAAAAAAAPPVTVAQPTKRTVTDWDEFTGRFDAVERRPAVGRARQGRTGETRTRPRAYTDSNSGGLGVYRRSAPSGAAGGKGRGDAGRRRVEGGPAQYRI